MIKRPHRLYTMSPEVLSSVAASKGDVRMKVWEFCKYHGVNPDTVVSLVMDPTNKQVTFNVATGVGVDDKGDPCIETSPIVMPLKYAPTWAGLCAIRAVSQ